MKYADIDNTGTIVGFYSTAVHGSNIPETAVPISDEQWLACLDAGGRWTYLGGVLAQSPAPVPTIEERREAMAASPAQIRVTLWQLDLIGTVQAIANADPKAAIVWEYATEIRRTNDLIDALGSDGFTPEQIDDIFLYAMQVKI